MKLVWLSLVVIASIILCKIISFGIILFSMWLKGKTFDFDSAKWEKYLDNISDKKLIAIILTAHFIAAAIASFAAYIILMKLRFNYALIISAVFFTLRILMTYYRINHKGKDYIHQKLLQIKNS